MVTRQFADKTTYSQSSHGVAKSWTSQLAERFDLIFAGNICYKCDLW